MSGRTVETAHVRIDDHDRRLDGHDGEFRDVKIEQKRTANRLPAWAMLIFGLLTFLLGLKIGL